MCRLTIVFSLIIWLLTGCVASTPPVVKIGLIAPFEELYRDDGYAVLAAVRLAVAERNAAGGVAGHQVLLVALNDNGRAEESRSQAANLALDPQVMGVTGLLSRRTALAAGPVLAQQGLPWLPLASLEPEHLAGGFALEAAPADLVNYAASLTASGEITLPVQLAVAGVSLSSSPAAWLWLDDAAAAAQALPDLGAGSILLGGPELGSPVFVGRVGPSAAGVRWFSAASPLPAFSAAYRAATAADPAPRAALAYDAASLLLAALDEAGADGQPLTRPAVAAALARLGQQPGWQGVSGVVQWQPCTAAGPCGWRATPTIYAYRW